MNEISITKKRLKLLLVIQGILCIIILGRSMQLQVFPNEKLNELKKRQYLRTVRLVPKRGVITDRNGDELAISLDVSSIYAHPHLIKNRHKTAKIISSITGLSYKNALAQLNQRKKRFVWIARLISLDKGLKLSSKNLRGVGVIREAKRFYPNGQLASHLLGFVGTDGNGLEGVELGFNQYLTGPPTYMRITQDAIGRPISMEDRYYKTQREGYTVELTIDKNLQFQLEKVLSQTVREEEASGGIGVMMDPYTGEILAMATEPSYDPNNFTNFPAEKRRNRVITDTFEPGSIFKIFLVAAALENNVVKPQTKVWGEKGKYRVENIVIGEASGHKFEWLTTSEVIKFSSNIGAVKIAEKLGRDNFYLATKHFGFGQKTGVDLPGETRGIVQNKTQWSRVTLSNVSFGQGIGVSVIQIARALSSIANGGNLVRPFIVKRVLDRDNQTIEEQLPQVDVRVISENTAKQLQDMMVEVTKAGGTGVQASIPGFVVAGKTGTAQKPNPHTGGYYSDRYVSAFIGFVPAEKPRFVLAVLIDDPRKRHYGGQVSAPAFRQISERSLRVLEVTPQGTSIEIASPGTQISWAKRELSQIQVIDADRGIMPDLSGLTMRQILQLFATTGTEVKIEGSGFAVTQYPEPGSEFFLSKSIRVKMEPKP